MFFHVVFVSLAQGQSRMIREICGIARNGGGAGRRAPGAGPLALLWRQSPAAPRRTTLLHVPFSESVAAAVLALPASGAVAVHASLAWSR